jgi:hypothetical protein
MKLANNDKLNFLVGIHVRFGEALTGGIVALHQLAYKLAKKGHNVYTFCKPEYPHENIQVIKSTETKLNDLESKYDWEMFSYPIDKTISIYPQITMGNPYNTKHVTRWILYHTEKGIEQNYGENDVYFNYGNFETFKNVEYRKLTVLNYNFEKLHVTNTGTRKGFCHLFHKNTPSDSKKIVEQFKSFDLKMWKTEGAFDFLREHFNKYEYFLTYDQKSFFTIAATLCGCKSIILNPGPPSDIKENAYTLSKEGHKTLTPTEYRLNNPTQMFGVAYGLDDIGWANKTIGLSTEYLRELEIIDDKTVDDFIDFWKKRTND